MLNTTKFPFVCEFSYGDSNHLNSINLEYDLYQEAKSILDKYSYSLNNIKTKLTICAHLNSFIKKNEYLRKINYRQKIQFSVQNNEIIVEFYTIEDLYRERYINYIEDIDDPHIWNFNLPIDL